MTFSFTAKVKDLIDYFPEMIYSQRVDFNRSIKKAVGVDIRAYGQAISAPNTSNQVLTTHTVLPAPAFGIAIGTSPTETSVI